jgi:hypothetical protein
MESTVADAPSAGAGVASLTARHKVPTPVAAYSLAAALTVALLPTAFSPNVQSWTFTPKVVVLLVVAAVGIVPLVRLARSSPAKIPARAALGFLLVGLVSVLLSSSLLIGFFGLYDWGTAWLFWLGCAGAFALGAYVRSDQLTSVLGGFVFAAAVNSITAITQVAAHPSGVLELYRGTQADGMLGNPIHLEALLLGALALIAGRASVGASRMLWWPAVLLFSVALEFTLERVALPIMLVIIVVAAGAYGLRRAAPFGALTLVGYGMGYGLGGRGLGTRVATGTANTTYGTRFRIWGLAVRALGHHPFLGIGPGQVISAIAPRVSSSFSAHLGPNLFPTDSHDFLIEVLATTGVLGFLAFATWLGSAALKAQGPFLACAIAMLAVELVEPLNLGVTPVALLALGAATVRVAGRPVGWAALRQWRRPAPEDDGSVPPAHHWYRGEPDRGSRRVTAYAGRVVTAVLVIVALVLGTTMLVGDHFMLTSYQDIQPQQKLASAKNANRLLPYWSDSAVAVANAYSWASSFNNSGTAPTIEALKWYLIAASRFPASPTLPADAGNLELQLGNWRAAQQDDLRALHLDPWTYLALEGLGTIAADEHDWHTSLFWYQRALIVAPSNNDLNRLIKADELHLQAG